jgi:hypothetical protein
MAHPRGQRIFFLESLCWFTGRAAVFFFLLSVLVLALYLLGNFQDFLDSTQVLLLTLLRLALLAEILLALLYIPLSIALGRQRVGRLLLCLLSAAYGVALLLATGFLSAWFQI